MHSIPVKKSQFLFDGLTALTAWFAIVMQAFLTTGSMGNLFSYFTILTNSLIAVSLTTGFIFSKQSVGIFFKSQSVRSAVALYIFIVALVYNTVLRGLVPLHGWSLAVDTLLHVIVPILYVVGWFVFVPKGTLNWKQGIYWLYFPSFYLVYSLVRGSFYRWYPYPFLNVITFGYGKVILNSCILIVVFMLSGFTLMGLDKKMGKLAPSK